MQHTTSTIAGETAGVHRLDAIEPLPGKPFALRAVPGEHVTLVEARPAAGEGLPEHAHPQEQLSLVLSGKVRFASGGREWIVGAGEVIHVPGGVEHASTAIEDAVVIEVFAPAVELGMSSVSDVQDRGGKSVGTVRVHHFGLTVADIERTSRFYGRLGFKTPTKVVKNHYRWFGHWVGNPGALGNIAFMQHGDVMFELHQYDHPSGLSAVSPSTVYVGCPHIAIQVEDVRSLYEDLKAEGVDFLGPVTVIDEGETPGYVGVYCRDPDGYIIELVQDPEDGGMDIADYAA